MFASLKADEVNTLVREAGLGRIFLNEIARDLPIHRLTSSKRLHLCYAFGDDRHTTGSVNSQNRLAVDRGKP